MTNSLSLKTLCNLYLDHQESRAAAGEVKSRQVYYQTLLLRDFVRYIGPNQIVSNISTIDLQNYRRKLIKSRKVANTVNNRIAAVKAMYNWALDNEVIGSSPKLKAVKKITPLRQERPTFTVSQVQPLLQNPSPQVRAMIWLAGDWP